MKNCGRREIAFFYFIIIIILVNVTGQLNVLEMDPRNSMYWKRILPISNEIERSRLVYFRGEKWSF
jgi:hypothetical protein